MKSKLRTILLCLSLEVAAFFGVPMRPEEIEELLGRLSRPKLAHTIPDGKEDGEPDESGWSRGRGADAGVRPTA